MSFVPTAHTNPSFNDALATIGAQMTEMSRLSEASLRDACEALENRDYDLAKGIAGKDGRINGLQSEIILSVATTIAKHNPVAHDLHSLMGSVNLAQELERLADHAKNIGRRYRWLLKMDSDVAFKEEILEISRILREMYREFLSAENSSDMKRISEVWHMDDKVNDIYMSVMKKALAGEASDNPKVLINTIFIAKNFERIGDKIKNLAEVVTYQETGEIVDFDSMDEDEDETAAGDA